MSQIIIYIIDNPQYYGLDTKPCDWCGEKSSYDAWRWPFLVIHCSGKQWLICGECELELDQRRGYYVQDLGPRWQDTIDLPSFDSVMTDELLLAIAAGE